MKPNGPFSIVLKTTVTHTATYFMMGLIALTLFDYGAKYSSPVISGYMRQITDPLVAAGPLLQIVRGILFGIVFFLLKDIVFSRKSGWLTLWIVLVILGIVSPFGASPGSIEGMIYTVIPMNFHFTGLPEVLIQALLLSVITFFWVNHPRSKWLSWILGALFLVALIMSAMGYLASIGVIN